MSANWIVEPGKYGPRLVMHGPWSPLALGAVESARIRELELNYAKGWVGSDYSFLRQMPNLLGLELTDWNAVDVSAVNDLKFLRYLKVFTYCKTELLFLGLPLLEDCSLEWRPRAVSLFSHQGVKEVFINKCAEKDFTAMSKMISLESLSLASPKIETLRGIETLRSLSFLGLYVARRLTSLDGIESLTGLVGLEVNDCPKVTNIAPLEALRGLRRLQLCNDKDIDTFRPLSALTELEQVLFYESTNVQDGDLTPLKRLPRLKHVAFMERKHYSHRRSDFPVSGPT
ncbi:MAG: hypothetical protein SFV15_13320 [Polyangiaceae bacterium]|nr:hypothetical protein [Polyangiaceae bacterium]